MREWAIDVRHALRGLARAPGFFGLAVLALALGIGATTTVFSLINGVLLRPLPYRAPERLAIIWNDFPKASASLPAVSALDARDYRAMAQRFEGFAIGAPGDMTGTWGVVGGGDVTPERVSVGAVSANFFPLLGVDPLLGRHFTSDDERYLGGSGPMPTPMSAGHQVVMLSYGLWQRRFGGDRDVVGGSIEVDGVPHEIVAVLPRRFRLHLPPEAHLMTDADLWKPLRINWAGPLRRTTVSFTVLARLKPGVTHPEAQAEMNTIAARLRAEHPAHEENGLGIRLVPLHEAVVRQARPVLALLLGAAFLLLAIACANVANLLLARATSREREIAIRAAVGASRRQLAQLFVTEGLILGLLGGALGLLLAWSSTAALVSLWPSRLPRLAEARLDGWALAFTVLVSVGTAVIFSLAPAVHAARPESGSTLLSGGRVANIRRSLHLRQAIIVGEVALSLVLLVGAGLLVRSLSEIQRIRPGFDAAGVLGFQIALPWSKYATPAARLAFSEELRRRLGALPGVSAVAAVSQAPYTYTGRGHFSSYSDPDRPSPVANEGEATADLLVVTPEYFRTVRTRLLAGRSFTAADDSSAPPVVVVDEHIARHLWPGESLQRVVGRRIRVSGARPDTISTVVGIVEHARLEALTSDGPGQIYLSYARRAMPVVSYLLRISADANETGKAVRREVAAVDPGLAVARLLPLARQVSEASGQVRFALQLMQGIGLAALVLTGIGLYGVIAFAVARRRRELGVRLALGDTPAGLRRLVVRQGLALAVGGIACGVVIAAVTAPLLRSLLYRVHPLDPTTFGVVALFLAAVAVSASYVPARRASGIAPTESMRAD